MYTFDECRSFEQANRRGYHELQNLYRTYIEGHPVWNRDPENFAPDNPVVDVEGVYDIFDNAIIEIKKAGYIIEDHETGEEISFDVTQDTNLETLMAILAYLNGYYSEYLTEYCGGI